MITALMIHKGLLQRNVYAVVKDWQHSEELVNDTILKAYNEIKKGKYKEQSKIEGWLLRIARRKAIDFLDGQSRNVLAHCTQLENICIREEESVYRYDEKKLVNIYRAIYATRFKSRKQYNIIMLHYLHGFSLNDIAEITGKDKNTLRSRREKGIKNIKKALE